MINSFMATFAPWGYVECSSIAGIGLEELLQGVAKCLAREEVEKQSFWKQCRSKLCFS